MEEYIIEHPICRVCLQPAAACIEMDELMINELDDEATESQTYLECFKSCTQLDIKVDDGLPNHICSLCSTELRSAYEFIVKAKNSHDILITQADDVKTEYIIHEIDTDVNDLVCEETIYLPIDNVEEIFVEETDDLSGMVFKKEGKEELIVEDDSQGSESGVANHMWEVNSESGERIGEFNEEESMVNQASQDWNKCNLCNARFDKLEDLRRHGESEHYNVPFCCTTCCHRFGTQQSLTVHEKRKHEGTSVKCDICGNMVKSSFLRAHKRQVHKRVPFLCSACPRTFKTTTGLQIHSETHKENRERNFECEHCHKKFLTVRTYKVHIRTHWHREPFKCNLCDKKFLQKVNLRLHMQMHRGETMDCLHCDKKFVRRTDLDVHMRFHTGNYPYECQYCDKRFAIVSHLNYHQKRHQGFIYKCDVCDKEFINMSGLRNHSFQHTAMPFVCSVCDKGFPTNFKIKRHLKTVHHIEDLDQLKLYIVKEKIKLESSMEEETTEEVLIEEADGDHSNNV